MVYPTHGVGKILGIETQEIAGHSLNVFVVHFDKDRMTLRVPVAKAKGSGLRRLSTRKEMDAALAKLKGRSRAKRTMWSRRAQEYEAKINSGDPASIAEVVRDLYRNAGQPEQSYSERQIYQAALDRLVREFAAVEKIDEGTATQARRADAERGAESAQAGAGLGGVRPAVRFRDLRTADAARAASGRSPASTARRSGFAALHDRLAERLVPATGSSISATISAMAPTPRRRSMRSSPSAAAFLAQPQCFLGDVVLLRGSQEEMWQKLLELQFAPNPREVLAWMLEHGVAATLGVLWRRSAARARRLPRRACSRITRWTGTAARGGRRPGRAIASS